MSSSRDANNDTHYIPDHNNHENEQINIFLHLQFDMGEMVNFMIVFNAKRCYSGAVVFCCRRRRITMTMTTMMIATAPTAPTALPPIVDADTNAAREWSVKESIIRSPYSDCRGSHLKLAHSRSRMCSYLCLAQ